MFSLSQKRVRSLSRDRDFLVRSSIAIVVGSIILALSIWFALGQRQSEDWFPPMLKVAREDPVKMLEMIRNSPFIVARLINDEMGDEWTHPLGDPAESAPKKPLPPPKGIPERIDSWLKGATFDPATLKTLRSFATARFAHREADQRSARSDLEAAANSGPPPMFIQECLGDLEFNARQWKAAIALYEGELALRESKHARSQIVEIAVLDPKSQALSDLLQDPKFRAATPVYLRFDAYAKLRDYGGIFSTVLAHDYLNLRASYVGLTLFVALVWFFIVGQFSGFRADQLLIYLGAIFLGALSATITLFVVVVQEEVFGLFPDTADFIQGLVNNVAGTGLREETIKLLCFLPLLPLMLKRKNPVEVVIVAGFVGLGFAIQENLSYYSLSSGSATVGRFLTANFFHLSLTGLIGYAAWRFARNPRRNWEELLATFLIAVISHGLYNALQTLPEFEEFGFLSIIVFALLSYRFFGVVHSLPMTWRQELSPLGIFVIGTSLLVGATLNVVCFGQHPYPTYLLFLFSTIQLVPIAFIFVNTFRNS